MFASSCDDSLGIEQDSCPYRHNAQNENPWNDRLRMIRYDEGCHDWLLSTSEGFYSLNLEKATVKALNSAPPVSVMGLNVLQKDKEGKWLCGSFSGLFTWDRQQGTAIDYFTGKVAPKKAGAPFGKKAIAGMSQDLPVLSLRNITREHLLPHSQQV